MLEVMILARQHRWYLSSQFLVDFRSQRQVKFQHGKAQLLFNVDFKFINFSSFYFLGEGRENQDKM